MRLQSLWFQLTVNLLMSGNGKGGDVVPIVELYLSVGLIGLSMGVNSDLLCAELLTVPHRHKPLFEPGGRLSLFFTSSKHTSSS